MSNNSKSVLFLAGAAALVLAACTGVETRPDDSGNKPQTRQGEAQPQAKTSVERPSGISYTALRQSVAGLPEAVDGDEFMAAFRPEIYLETAPLRQALNGAVFDVLKSRKYSNEFERNKAMAEFRENGVDTLGQAKALPKFVQFSLNYALKPGGYSFKSKQFGVSPSWRLSMDVSAASKLRIFPDLGSPRFSPYADGFQKAVGRYLPGSAYGKYEVSKGEIRLKLGLFSQDWGGKGSTNLVNFVNASPDEFNELMNRGLKNPKDGSYVYFQGFAVYQVVSKSPRCMGGRAAGYLSSIESYGCEIEMLPYKYILRNFLGKENYVIDVKTIKLD